MLHLHHIVTYWNNVRSVTMRFLDAFPADQLAFRPIDTVFTARQQFQHLIASQVMFVRGWTTGTWDFPWRDGQWVATNLVNDSFEGVLSIDAMALYAIDEEIHHRAQLAIYLRCLGIQPPPFVQRYQDLSPTTLTRA